MLRFKVKLEGNTVRIPEPKKHHCDMAWFRKHSYFGSYANSDIFLAVLKRYVKPGLYDITTLPAGWAVDEGRFFVLVVIDMDIVYKAYVPDFGRIKESLHE